MRFLLLLVLSLIAYYALKAVVRSAFGPSRKEPAGQPRQMGEEMVLDPECRTYVVKHRAITRRINGKLCSFCSEDCAKRFEEKNRP